MWLRFITFCVLVSFVLFVVLSCIHGRPVIYLLFRRCCEDDIENDQVIYENFGNNFLRERLVGVNMNIDDNDSLASGSDVAEMVKALREQVNVHDLNSRNKNDFAEGNKNLTKKQIDKSIAEQFEELIETLVELDQNLTFNDILIDSHETNNGKELTLNNEVLSELDSNEVNSVEVTTENAKNRSSLPIKLVQLDKKGLDNNTSAEIVNKDGTEKKLLTLRTLNVVSNKKGYTDKSSDAL